MSRPLILIAEDDDGLRSALAVRLNHAGYEVIESPDGDTAIALARQKKPDLLILDVHMPNADGLCALDALDQQEDFHGIPVIFITGDTSPEIESAAKRRGAFWVFRKPIETSELLELVHHLAGPVSDAA